MRSQYDWGLKILRTQAATKQVEMRVLRVELDRDDEGRGADSRTLSSKEMTLARARVILSRTLLLNEALAASTEGVDEVEVVEEVDYAVVIEVGGGKVGGEGIDEVEVVEEVDDAILVEVGWAADEDVVSAD
jgi:hypothetical protein